MDLGQSNTETQGMFTSGIFIMDSQKAKESMYGRQVRSMKGISKTVSSMDLENGKKEWEMGRISIKVSTRRIKDVVMVPSHGDSLERLTEGNSKKTQ